MRFLKIFYVALAAMILIFGSCSMNKDAVNTSYLGSGRLQSRQQLIPYHIMDEKMAKISLLVIQNSAKPELSEVSVNPQAVQAPMIKPHIKPFLRSHYAVKSGKSFPKLANIPNEITSLIKIPTHKASVKNLPFEGANYLALWIVFLIASIVFYFLAVYAFDSIAVLALIFNILGLLALLAFLLFIILWIVKIYKEKQEKEQNQPQK